MIVTFVAQRTVVHQVSMLPTLVEGDNLVVEKISPKIGNLHRGDIIVFNVSEDSRQLIKRVIALGGDKVEIKDGKVFVNGIADDISNPKGVTTLPGSNPDYSKFEVKPGYIYALGDNRPDSHDCRDFGPIKVNQVSGKAIFRFYPFNKIGIVK